MEHKISEIHVYFYSKSQRSNYKLYIITASWNLGNEILVTNNETSNIVHQQKIEGEMMGFTSYLGNNYSTIDVAPNQPDLFVVQKFLAERIPEKKIRIVLHRSVRLGTSHY